MSVSFQRYDGQERGVMSIALPPYSMRWECPMQGLGGGILSEVRGEGVVARNKSHQLPGWWLRCF